MWCKECETITEMIFKETNFWLFLPTVDAEKKLLNYLAEHQIAAMAVADKTVHAILAEKQIEAFVTSLFGLFNWKELDGTTVVTTECGEPKLSDLRRVITLRTFINRFKSSWIIEAINNKQYESWYQPILKLSPNGETTPFAHEALFRMRDTDGEIMPPAHIFATASYSDLLFTLDLVARRSAVEDAARAGLKNKIFINFNPSSIYDPAYCLRKTASAIEAAGFKPSDIVFEITETHSISDKNHIKGILAFYRQNGFGVALDDIGSGWSGLNMLHEFRPDYMKIDMDLIRDIDTDTYKQTIVRHLISSAKENAIKTIAEGIETEAEAQWVASIGVDYVQGYYYGKPERKNVVDRPFSNPYPSIAFTKAAHDSDGPTMKKHA